MISHDTFVTNATVTSDEVPPFRALVGINVHSKKYEDVKNTDDVEAEKRKVNEEVEKAKNVKKDSDTKEEFEDNVVSDWC